MKSPGTKSSAETNCHWPSRNTRAFTGNRIFQHCPICGEPAVKGATGDALRPNRESGFSADRHKRTFTGQIDGESTVRALQVQRPDKSARMVSVQRFRGKLGSRKGTFVLQGQETVENGKIRATWFVVPGSGTEDLASCAAGAASKASLGKDPTDGSTIGSNNRDSLEKRYIHPIAQMRSVTSRAYRCKNARTM